MEEQKYLIFKFLCREQRTKIFLVVMLSISILLNPVLSVGSCLK